MAIHMGHMVCSVTLIKLCSLEFQYKNNFHVKMLFVRGHCYDNIYILIKEKYLYILIITCVFILI